MMERRLPLRQTDPRDQRGIALIGVVGLLLVFLIFAGAMLDQLAIELNSTKMSAVSNRALNAADAGVRAMVEQIQTNLAHNAGLPPTQNYSYPEPGGAPSVVSYSATILKTWPSGSLNYYLIESTGTYSNGVLSTVKRTVRALVKSQPLADFASFSNYETNQFGNQVWYLSTQHFNGPVYSGGPMHIAYATPAPTALPTVEPIFLDKVQTVNTPVWNPGDPNLTGDWSSVISGGSTEFASSANPLSLPQSSSNLAVASEAWEGDSANTFSGGSGFPAVAPGVYIDGSTAGGADAANATNPVDTTGIYINTANSSATITSTVSGNTDTMKITSPAWSGTYIVTMNYTPNFASSGDCSGTTTVTFGSASHTFSGTPCGEPGVGVTNPGAGAIFSNGNINLGNAGTPNTTIEGSYTIATPDYNGWPKNGATISILDNLTYDGPSSAYDELGLWANNVVLTGKTTTNVQIDAAIIAGWPGEPANDGTFNNKNCTKVTCGNFNQGTLTVLGSLVENARGAVGEVVAGSQFGFARIVDFDQRFATSPPPFNPTTGQLEIVAWDDLGS